MPRYSIFTMEYAVITAVGADKVGIMDSLAGAVVGLEANIEETRASILGGEFAVIMLVSGAEGFSDVLGEKLTPVAEGLGLTISTKRTSKPGQPKGLPYIIESLSLDTPGIVHSITKVLKDWNINIEDLESGVRPAPLSGSPMFEMRIVITIVPGAALAKLKQALAALGTDHDLDIEVRPLIAE
jgi:glycine cleavage system transcriptional repressor